MGRRGNVIRNATVKRDNVISVEEGLRLGEELEEEITGSRKGGAKRSREGADNILMQGL